MPRTLRSVQLSDLQFLGNGGNWYDLITEIRTLIQEQILWPKRDVKVAVSLSDDEFLGHGIFCRGIWLEKAVHGFLYGSGQNPFLNPKLIGVGFGIGVESDAFEPNHARLYFD